jgi:hypothetical protein
MHKGICHTTNDRFHGTVYTACKADDAAHQFHPKNAGSPPGVSVGEI